MTEETTLAETLAARLSIERSLVRALRQGDWTERASVLAVSYGLAEMAHGADGPYRKMTPLGEAVQKIMREQAPHD
jgi:hypothetical protein